MTDTDAMPRPPLLIANEIYRKSRYGTTHPLSIPRVSTVVDLCRALDWLPDAQYVDSPMATPAQLARFHDPAYIAALKRAEEDRDAPADVKARHNIGINNNPIYTEVFRRPATACGGSILAADLVKDGGIVHHPPGGTHHGRPDRASGFCYFNDPVLGLLRLLDLGVAPVLYVDLDAHHGDGVQDAFHDDDRVFTISIHEADRWPRTGPVEDRAGGAARNLPVPRGFNDSELDYLIEHAVVPLAERLKPAAIMIQGGCDGLEDDPQARLSLSNRGYWQAVSVLKGLAPRVIVLGGGGYNPWAVARCWSGVWATLNGRPIPEVLPAPAESVLRELWWAHRRGRNPPEHWFTTLADAPNAGAVRDEVRAVARAVLDAPDQARRWAAE
ncbi:acetoin utilization protein AcuC [Caenispirillum salinarum]|uniref:acetoin utilization protein AcuC n=1 Tax=Caenispirillum salinarum TaxID=859058 RepID=UPI00384FD15A